jgi:glycine/D-amino acid oxidase-like deaminating enzyme
MDLVSGSLFWHPTIHPTPSYPTVDEDLTCDVLVIGGGIGGLLCATLLAEQHLKTILIEKDTLTSGSTQASTGLLQYSSDKHLSSCIHTFGETNGVRFYRLCRQSIHDLEALCARLPIDAQFHPRESLYYASCRADVPKLQAEYEALQRYGFDATYWDAREISRHFSFSKPAAIFSNDSAEVNPVALSFSLAQYGIDHNLRIYEHSKLIRWDYEEHHVNCYTRKHRIRARKVIFAKGYETAQMTNDPNAVLVSTYAIATEPVREYTDWYQRAMIWETARPYLYLRTTDDNRILIGGLDERTIRPEERDSKLLHKSDVLLNTLKSMFPNIPDIQNLKIAYHWAGVFGSTHDGYPIIGEHPSKFPNCYFVQAFGGNGMAYNLMAAQIIRDFIIKGAHPDADMFRLYRSNEKKPLPS